MARKPCIFCGGSPRTQEHYLGKAFIERLLGGDSESRYDLHRSMYTEATETTERNTWVAGRPDMTSKCACGPCNSGWMDQARRRIEPLIEPMILGRPTRITKLTDIAALASWATQVGICASYRVTNLAETLGPSFYEKRKPPATHRIRLATGVMPETRLQVATNVVQLFTSPITDPARVEGYSVTIRIQHLILQVFCPPAGHETEVVSKTEWEALTIPVWPLTVAPLDWPWPPRRPLDLIDFHHLTQAYFEPPPET